MSLFSSWLASAPPEAAIAIGPDAVSLAVVGGRGDTVQAFASAALPEGAVVPSLGARNVVDRAAVVAALRAVFERTGQRPRRAALVLSDLAARASLVRFDQLPPRRDDLEQLIRWQVKKSSPLPIEDACLSFSPGARHGAGGEFVVVVASRAAVEEYEGVCAEVGVHAGLVDVSTICLVNLYLAAGAPPADDWLLVHMRPEATSLAILRGGDLIYVRTRAEGDEGALADVVHQTAMYYQDRLGGQGFARVLIGGRGRDPRELDGARQELEARLGSAVEPIDVTRAVALGDRVTASAEERAALGPLAGVLLRARREAVPA